MKIKCPYHGIFEQLPTNHIHNNSICPDCGRKESKGEQAIATILTEMNKKFIRQHSFDDCRGNVRPLKYDFYIPSHNYVIEFDGPQHFRFVPHLHRTISLFEQSQEYDSIKDRYCEANNISLTRIKTNSVRNIRKILRTLIINS